MRNYDDITIEQGALHIVNPRQGHLGLTEAELDLGDGVSEFLTAHVERGLADPQASAASFIVAGADRASGIAERILGPGREFVAHTADLARLLYAASENDERVKDGTLAVLRCNVAEGPFLSILKLDPSSAYRPVEKTDAQGKKVVGLVLEPEILPGVRERLQKAAFIRTTEGDGYHMLLVDRQRPGETISRFFVQDFLGAESVYDAASRTRELYKSLTNAKNDVAPGLEADELARLEQYLDGQVVGERVNVDDLLAGLPTSDEVREQFRERVDHAMPDREFDLDPEIARGFVKTKRFAGDNHLRLIVPSDFYDDMIETQPPGDHSHWTIVIRTREWRQT